MSDRSQQIISWDQYIQRFVERDPDGAREFLRDSWLSNITVMLRQQRINAGLTQQELAERLGTTQSAIARLENEADGRITLHRVVDYALACGVLPFDLEFAPINEMVEFTSHKGDEERTSRRYDEWQRATRGGTEEEIDIAFAFPNDSDRNASAE